MEYYKEKIHSLLSRLNEKQIKKMELNTLLNLIEKFRDINDIEIESSFKKLVTLIAEISNEEKPSYREYKSDFSILRKLARKNYGYIKKGALSEESIGFGLAIGVAIGAGMTTINSGMMGVGIAIGIAIGAGIGSKREKEALEKGILY